MHNPDQSLLKQILVKQNLISGSGMQEIFLLVVILMKAGRMHHYVVTNPGPGDPLKLTAIIFG